MAKSKSTDDRKRNFATELYLDSGHPEWLNILKDSHIPIFVSPLHDKDLKENGEPVKPHHHIMVMYEGKKSKDQVRDFFDTFGGHGLLVVESVRGMARYLCHLDDPDKYQYDISDVKCFGGADYAHIIGLASDKYKAIKEMKDFINETGIINYCDLFDYAADERYDWFRILCDSGTLVIKEYMKSKKWAMVSGAGTCYEEVSNHHDD